MTNGFWDGFYFGAGFAASQLIFIFIVALVIGIPLVFALYVKTVPGRKSPPESHPKNESHDSPEDAC